ncbi:DUF4124 domain-containing protein [Pelomonas sp. SE-A7]|uniref:DUF4124 domain-containing protein n=1 Tax=Pelomonas sp. SE-A7 TaxID=3054953 RepID=UPI00259CCF9C|nr:DUF4124 domain-containing protein [Pelomonas sp. SE-A7]MDM4765761.1 DUF4124 domain-containing protein [Pelomonas sp. SE-A7]
MRLSTPLCLLLLLALAGGVQAQSQWKWRDSGGNIQYSDRPPPPGTPEKDILQKPPQRPQFVTVRPIGASAPAETASAPAAPASRPDAQQQRQRQQDQEQAAAKQKEAERKQAEVRAENCRNARAQLQVLESGARVRQANERGEQVYLDEQGRNTEIQRTRAVIAAECR